MSGTTLPLVSISVVVYNSDHCVRECLSSVRDIVRDGRAQLIVVDNASPDQSAQLVTNEFPEAELVRSKVNEGFAAGCNLAWPRVRGRYWLLLNPDVVVSPGGLEGLVRWMDEHPQIGAASPLLVGADGKAKFVGRRLPRVSLTILESFRLHLLIPKRKRAEMFLGPYWTEGGDHLEVDWVPGTALIARCAAVETVGLLSESLFMYGEDTEWCWRMRKAGWRVAVCGGVQFHHREGQSALRTWGEFERSLRMWRGLYAACSEMRGSIYARVLMLVNVIGVAIEAFHPRRSSSARRQSRSDLRIHGVMLAKEFWSGFSYRGSARRSW